MINVRKLAAIDLQFLGPKIILTEFGLGVVGSAALGLLTIRTGIQRFHSRPMIVFGAYLFLLGINYVPLLIHAICMVHDGSALNEIAGELRDKGTAFRKYRRQSLWLLVPVVVPMAAIVQALQRRRTARHANNGLS